jgi:mercuric transport protein
MRALFILLLLQLPGLAIAGEPKTVTLAVEHMTCAACPITVKKALTAVPGVQHVVVDLGTQSATVTFDPATTGIPALESAVTNAGYPAHARDDHRD